MGGNDFYSVQCSSFKCLYLHSWRRAAISSFVKYGHSNLGSNFFDGFVIDGINVAPNSVNSRESAFWLLERFGWLVREELFLHSVWVSAPGRSSSQESYFCFLHSARKQRNPLKFSTVKELRRGENGPSSGNRGTGGGGGWNDVDDEVKIDVGK